MSRRTLFVAALTICVSVVGGCGSPQPSTSAESSATATTTTTSAAVSSDGRPIALSPTEFGGHMVDVSGSRTLVVSMYKLSAANVLSFAELTFVRTTWGASAEDGEFRETGGYGSAPIAPDATVSCDTPQCAQAEDDFRTYAFTPATLALFLADARQEYGGLTSGVDAVIRIRNGRIVDLRQFRKGAAMGDPGLDPNGTPGPPDPVADVTFGAGGVVTYVDALYRDHLVPGNLSGGDPHGVPHTASLDPNITIMCHNSIGPIDNGWTDAQMPVAVSLANFRKVAPTPYSLRAILRLRGGRVVDMWQLYVD